MIDWAKIKCVAFDADNTLYSTRSIAKEADLAGLQILAAAIKKPIEDLYAEFIEIVNSIKNSPDLKLRHRKYSYGRLCDIYRVSLIDEMYAAFFKQVIDKIEIMPGTLDILIKLRERALYVITEDNREMAEAKLTRLNLINKFKGIVTSDDVGVMKPSKDYYAELIASFRPEEILVIGDDYEKDLKIPEEMKMNVYLMDSDKAMFALRESIK